MEIFVLAGNYLSHFNTSYRNLNTGWNNTSYKLSEWWHSCLCFLQAQEAQPCVCQLQGTFLQCYLKFRLWAMPADEFQWGNISKIWHLSAEELGVSGAVVPLNLCSALWAHFNFQGSSEPSVLLTYEPVQTSKQAAGLIRHLIIDQDGKECIWEIKTRFSTPAKCQCTE